MLCDPLPALRGELVKSCRLPPMVRLPPSVFAPAPLKVTLAKVLAPMACAEPPLKLMVPEPGLNVPLTVQLPPTLCEKLPALKLEPELTRTFLATVNAPVAVLVAAPVKL